MHEKVIELSVPVTDGEFPEIPDPTPPKKAEFDDFRVEVTRSTNSLLIYVYDIKTGRLITQKLYQCGPDLKNQFHGSHGFSGLNYIYHPTTEAELQFIAKVK